MLLVLHIIIALSGIAFAGFAFLKPSGAKLRISYGLSALTISSGTLLIVSEPATMLRGCVTGLLYLAVVTAANVFTRQKLLVVQSDQA